MSITSSPTVPLYRVVLIRPGSVTHHFDFEQRYVQLANTSAVNCSRLGCGHCPARHPRLFRRAPPGYYMLFVVEERTDTYGNYWLAPSVSQTVLVQ